MAILNIVKEGDPVLRKKSREVTEITPRIIQLLDDMRETLSDAQGCGLAAVQVGVLRRIVLVDTEETGLLELINPKIVAFSGTQEETEGCLSVPGVWGITRRPKNVTVKALNRNGEEITVTGSDLAARAFCHELDHLEGTLFIDHMIEKLDPEDFE